MTAASTLARRRFALAAAAAVALLAARPRLAGAQPKPIRLIVPYPPGDRKSTRLNSSHRP